MTDPSGQIPSWQHAAWAGIAILGGVAQYLDTYLKGGEPPTWKRMTAHAFVSGFSGYMIAQIALLVKPEWAFICAGVAGYLGTRALDIAADFLRKRAGADSEPKS